MVAQNMVRTYGKKHVLDLLKEFGYIERVVRADIFFGKPPI